MNAEIVTCPDCGGECVSIGRIPATDVFAGKELDRSLQGGELYRCRRCSLGFRWPRLAKEMLDSLYSHGDEHAWSVPADSRKDWNIARDWLGKRLPAGSRILDIGCFDGGFLEPMVGRYQCMGIEIHDDARNRAAMKGVKVIGEDFAAVSGNFDCITAFDVIEHVERPRLFLENCFASVPRGGCVLVSTGNLDSFTFRMMGSRYWYSTIAEHISFVSPEWFARLSDDIGFHIAGTCRFSHGKDSYSRRIRQSCANILYRYAPRLFRITRKLGMGGKRVNAFPELVDFPPAWGSARDHFMVLMQKL